MDDNKLELGTFIMDIFKRFINSQNEKEWERLGFEGRNKFKPQKATQAKLAEILEEKKTNLSAYLSGNIKIPMEMIFDIAEKLEVTSKDFLELAKLFAMQDPAYCIESDSNSKDIPVIDKINQSFAESVTAKLLFEFYKKRAPAFMKKRWRTNNLYKMNRLHEKYNTFYTVNNSSNSEIAEILFDK